MFNPFEQTPIKLIDGVMDWQTVYPKPYSKHDTDPYTKIRIILMNGIETEAAMFGHQFHRHCPDNELRRIEQLQFHGAQRSLRSSLSDDSGRSSFLYHQRHSLRSRLSGLENRARQVLR